MSIFSLRCTLTTMRVRTQIVNDRTTDYVTFIGDPSSFSVLDVKLLGGVTDLLQMRVTVTTIPLNQERPISQLALDYGIDDFKPVLTPVATKLLSLYQLLRSKWAFRSSIFLAGCCGLPDIRFLM